jgi:hypothetical protein
MKRRSTGVFTLYVSSGLTCVALATATISASPSEHGRKDKHSGASPFVTMKPCSISDSGRFRFVSGRNPFQGGGGGAYGDIFFAGGGSRVEPTASTPAASAAQAPAAVAPVAPLPAPPRTATGTPAAGASPTAAGPTANATLPAVAAAAADAAVGADTPLPGTAGPQFDQDPPLPQPGKGPITSAAPSAVTPEPASLMLIGLGLSAVALIRRRTERNHRS